MKNEDAKTKENIENLSKVIEEKKKVPKEVKNKINTKIFENMAFGAIIFIYLGALNFGMINIPTENYIIDLKVFSIMLLVATIVTFELAYKKDKGELWIHAIEIMIISIFTAYLIYWYSIFYNNFGSIVISFALFCLVYYAVKAFIMKKKIVRDYNKSLIDIGEIVKK